MIGLDQGERESIALAKLNQALLLMDEEYGRKIARQQGLKVRGSLGVLAQAYREGYLTTDQLRLSINQMVDRSDIWINPTLCQRVLDELLGESE